MIHFEFQLSFILDGRKIVMRFMESGVLKFCPCEKKDRCQSFTAVLALALKISELCLYGIGLGYNIGASHFGVSEPTQKALISPQGFEFEPISGLYILTDHGKTVLKDSQFSTPAIPPCIFDCVKMPQ